MLRLIGERVWTPAPALAAAPSGAVAAPVAASVAAPAVAPAVAAIASPVARAGEPAAARPARRTAAAAPPAAAPRPAADAEPAEPPPEVARLGWAALRDAVAACHACGLCQSRTQTVFGTGHEGAQWMVVGEAPGEQEDLSGEPFVGAAGQLLDRMLAALQLTRAVDGAQPSAQRVYIANTLKCRPPRNRNPTPAELAQCEPFLLRQIELLQPRMILAMGRYAVQALLRSEEPVGRLRGRVHLYHGVPLVVTYHPAYLLRNLPDKARAWEDLCLAAEAAEGAAR
jgi:DNA polymerase